MKKLRNFIDLLKDFKNVDFWGQSNWGNNYKVFYILPALAFDWDTQCAPIAQEGKIIFEGCRDFTIYIEWLWVTGAVCFNFNWTVKNPKDFESVPPTESELKEIGEFFENL